MPLFECLLMSAEDWYERGCDAEATSPRRAARAYQNALALAPEHAGAHANLGRLLHEIGEVGAAEEHYRAAVRSRPDEATYWYNLGVALEDRGQADEARNAYRTAVTLDPDSSEAHYNLAGLLERTGDRTGALRHLAAYRRLGQVPAVRTAR